MKCYICSENYTIKGIDCRSCKKSCCGDCYMKMLIASKDTIKCGLCQFQAFSKPCTKNRFDFLVEYQAIRCGYSQEEALDWAILANR